MSRRGGDLVLARLDVGDEPGQGAPVVRLGKPFLDIRPRSWRLLHGQEEPVGGDPLHARVLGPAGEQCLEEPGDGGLADGDG